MASQRLSIDSSRQEQTSCRWIRQKALCAVKEICGRMLKTKMGHRRRLIQVGVEPPHPWTSASCLVLQVPASIVEFLIGTPILIRSGLSMSGSAPRADESSCLWLEFRKRTRRVQPYHPTVRYHCGDNFEISLFVSTFVCVARAREAHSRRRSDRTR